jgi:hypothetical protein
MIFIIANPRLDCILLQKIYRFAFFYLCVLSLTKEVYKMPITPEMILQDGADRTTSVNPYTLESGEVRKGTVAATLNNIALLNHLIRQEKSYEGEEEIQKIVAAIDQLIPSLNVIGMFDLFEPIYWIGEGEQIGRLVALSLYIKHYPTKVSDSIRKKLVSWTRNVTSPVLVALFKSMS